jgi:hypothetical protein
MDESGTVPHEGNHMKKFILSTMAVAAMAVGGVAQADVIDSVGNTISRIFGIPYDPTPSGASPIVSVYTDAYGNRYHVDAAGRHIPLAQTGSYRDQWGRTVYLGANNQPLYIEQHGQLIPYGTVAMADTDGDRVADQYDRSPYDARYR